jgi:hypothetical protein
MAPGKQKYPYHAGHSKDSEVASQEMGKTPIFLWAVLVLYYMWSMDPPVTWPPIVSLQAVASSEHFQSPPWDLILASSSFLSESHFLTFLESLPIKPLSHKSSSQNVLLGIPK